VERFGAKASKAAQANARKKLLEKSPLSKSSKRFISSDFLFMKLLFLEKKCWRQRRFLSRMIKIIIENFSLEVATGDRVAIIGKWTRQINAVSLLGGDLSSNAGSLECSSNLQ